MLNENQLKFTCYCQFSMILGVGQICELRQRIFKCETCKLYTSFVYNFKTFSILRAFPSINIAKL